MRSAASPDCGLHHTHLGFTLIELIVVIAVAAIIATVGVPSFQQFTARNEVAAEVLRIKTALALTRSAAITRRSRATLCPSSTLETCNPNGDWKGELAIFVGDGSASDAELLRIFSESLVDNITYNGGQSMRYGTLGRASGTFGTFQICGRMDQGASIIVNITGRVRVESERPTC